MLHGEALSVTRHACTDSSVATILLQPAVMVLLVLAAGLEL